MTKKILIVDDNPGIQELLGIIFRKAGYTVCIESKGEAIIEGDFELPDIILLDRQLSGMDGLIVCGHLKRSTRTKDIPVIMVSASPDLKSLAPTAGADAFLEKPFDIKDILKLVESQLASTV